MKYYLLRFKYATISNNSQLKYFLIHLFNARASHWLVLVFLQKKKVTRRRCMRPNIRSRRRADCVKMAVGVVKNGSLLSLFLDQTAYFHPSSVLYYRRERKIFPLWRIPKLQSWNWSQSGEPNDQGMQPIPLVTDGDVIRDLSMRFLTRNSSRSCLDLDSTFS